MVRWWTVAGLAGIAGLTSSLYCIATDNRWFYRHVVMRACQAIDPETAHVMAIRLAQLGVMPKHRGPDDKILASFISCTYLSLHSYMCIKILP